MHINRLGMEKLAYKKLVLQRAREEQQKILNDFANQIKDLQESEIINDDDQLDDQQQSIDSIGSDLISIISNELNFANEEMNLLNKMRVGDKTVDYVAIGSIVRTDKATFYPSVSIENFNVDGDELFGLSLKAPIYEVMEGKRVGDTFHFKGIDYTILEIF